MIALLALAPWTRRPSSPSSTSACSMSAFRGSAQPRQPHAQGGGLTFLRVDGSGRDARPRTG
ncbi:hypothetical protein BE15_25955 [Sorangium cellulosum]|uniref:Uncharacterized protein n=1 Tax=Sorangium cellulosum TaxID=56 RepID=A0A150QBF7_SORCE|nr:hypothetical protein BE15_25955 [Sorangium cellulosum]